MLTLLLLLSGGASAAPSAAGVADGQDIFQLPTASEAAALRQRVEAVRIHLPLGAAGQSAQRQLASYSLGAEADRLLELLGRQRIFCNPAREVRRLEQAAALLAQGKLPHQRPGLHRLAYRSALDRRAHSFALYVPPGYSPKKRYPLVVMLHGMNSSPLRALGRLFGLSEGDLGTSRLVCDRPRLPDREVLVVAPSGFGDALFRFQGEVDVLSVLRQVKQLYRVDSTRVTITGLSMGGTGAAEIAFHHPQLFSGVLALCGYYDRFQDKSSRGRPLLDWEKNLMAVHSPVHWAANGFDLPLMLLHGRRDGPERALRLKSRYEELGYPVQLELYPVGHEVWEPGYRGGRAFKLLSRYRRREVPRKVAYATGRPRIGRGHWLQIDRFADHRRWAVARGEVQDRRHLTVETQNVAELSLLLPRAHLSAKAPLSLTIDTQPLTLVRSRAARWRYRLSRRGERWSLAGPRARSLEGHKRAGLSGPIEDVYFEPLVVVYGTGAGASRGLREQAKKLAKFSRRVDVQYPLFSDRRYRPSFGRRSALLLVGNERENRLLARLGPKLPIRVDHNAIRVGGQVFRGEHLGALFIYPNPEQPGRYLLVLAGTSARAYELYWDLPSYLPDYVIFDERIARRRSSRVLGAERAYVKAGYFDEAWRLSE